MAPQSFIINSPFACPTCQWVESSINSSTLKIVEGWCLTAKEVFDMRSNTCWFEPLDQVNSIRERVNAWRAADCPCTTTSAIPDLLQWHWVTAK